VWSLFAHNPGIENFGYFLLLAALGVFLYRKSQHRRSDTSFTDQKITIRDLLKNPRFTVYASNPAGAGGVEADLQGKLSEMKSIISASVVVGTKRTFEL
jgi:hypothetical protein